MFNPTFLENAAPAGFAVLELVADPTAPDGPVVIERPPRPQWGVEVPAPLAHAPLARTELRGTITGPVAAFRLVQHFRIPEEAGAAVLEARYRFPLPGDAAVTGVVVRFGEVEVRTTLAARTDARAAYEAAKAAGYQAALLERESADVFTLSIAGLHGAESVEVETHYVQRAGLTGGRWSVRVPLTTAPRFARGDEAGLPQARANPLAVLRDPGHRFALDVVVRGATGAGGVTSPTHALRVEPAGDDAVRVRLDAGEVMPDRDCVLQWPTAGADLAIEVAAEDGPDGAFRYLLALVRPPAAAAALLPRDLLLLVDRSGSMGGAKWEATRWAVRRLLAGLRPDDRVQLGAFDTEVVWMADGLLGAGEATAARAEHFLDANGPRGGTELGTALETALLARPRVAGDGVARHLLVVTDGQVTDEGRILATAEREAGRPADRRRVSVLCIDSAPNASLAGAMAEAGRGSAHFLSSDPSDGDVATALEEVLDGFDAPLAAGLVLTVDRPDVAAPSRPVEHDGATSRVELGDLAAGRPAWVVLRLPASAAAGATLRVTGAGLPTLESSLDEAARRSASATAGGSVRAAFGAGRVRALEQLAGRGSVEAMRAGLRRLGYDPDAVGVAADPNAVYAANAAATASAALQALLVRESLEAGVPSTATAFVAVRTVAGRRVEEEVDVANALPAGWSGAFVTGGHAVHRAASASRGNLVRLARMAAPAEIVDATAALHQPIAKAFSMRSAARPVRSAEPPTPPMSASLSYLGEYESPALDPSPPHGPSGPLLWGGVPAGRDGEAVLYDSTDLARGVALPAGVLSALLVRLAGDRGALPPGARLLLYVGDLAQPVARVELAAVLAMGGRRPLNVRRAGGERVRLVLELPAGVAWPAAAGALRVSLEG
jgi:Ca-activated chloride channel family protein